MAVFPAAGLAARLIAMSLALRPATAADVPLVCELICESGGL